LLKSVPETNQYVLKAMGIEFLMFNETNKSLNDGGLNSRLSDNPPIGSQMPLKPMNHAAPYNNCVFVDR